MLRGPEGFNLGLPGPLRTVQVGEDIPATVEDSTPKLLELAVLASPISVHRNMKY